MNGNMLFYVISTEEETFLFDRNNKHVVPPDKGRIIPYSNFLAVCSPDISIVPYQEGVVYHILTAGRIWEYNLAKNQITAATSSNTRRMAAGSSLDYGAFNFSSNGYKYLTSTQAVRRLNNNCTPKYRTYSLVANGTQSTFRGIRVYEISESLDAHQVKDTVIQDYPITSYQGISTSFEYSQSEMELSNDGSKLALVENKNIFVFNLNTNGTISGVAAAYNYNTSSTRYAIAGVEFDGNNKLLYSVYDIYSTSWSGRGLYAWDISNNTHTKFSSSESFCLSSIEKGKDGHCYTSKQDGIYRLNLSNNNIVAHLTGITLTPRFDMFKKFYPSATVNNPVYYLPDQLDGQTSEFLDLTETVFTYNFGTLLTGSFNWNNSSHGFTTKGNGKVLVLNAINVPSTASAITLDGMTIEFYDDASFNLSPDAQVTLKGTILKGSACGLMWKGISMMKGSGRLSAAGSILIMQKNTAGQNTQLHDAYTGVDLFGNRNRLEVLDGTLFKANERHLRINEGDLNRIKIWESNFNGAQFLRDQERGDASGYGDGKRRTIDGILVINSNIRIGDASRLNNNIYGGQNGIYAIGSSLDITKANIHLTKKHGLLFNANQLTNKTLSLKQSFVHDLFKGVRVEGRTLITIIQQNSIYNTSAYGIEYVGNNGGKLKIGDETNVALGNTFNNCNWAAVQCDNNQRFNRLNNSGNSTIRICNNSIDNHIYAAGIAISESVNGQRSYEELLIKNNLIGLNQPLGKGIKINNLEGRNKENPLDRNSPSGSYNVNAVITGNRIRFTQQLSPGNPDYCGISSTRGFGLNYFNNTIYHHNYSGLLNDIRPVAMQVTDGQHNLLAENTFRAGKGLVTNGAGNIFSNYYCNHFQECVVGLELNNSMLRNFAMPSFTYNEKLVHGHKFGNDTFSRTNAFLPTPRGTSKPAGLVRPAGSTDIRVMARQDRTNQWDFPQGFVLPRIDYPNGRRSPRGIVHNENRKLMCNDTWIWGDRIFRKDAVDTLSGNQQIPEVDSFVSNWKLNYAACRTAYFDSQSLSSFDSGLVKLVYIESLLSLGANSQAYSLLNNWNPSHTIESDFKSVYSIICEARLSADSIFINDNSEIHADTLWTAETEYVIDTVTGASGFWLKQNAVYSDSAIDSLIQIARKDGLYTSPAAYVARAVLEAERQLFFHDTVYQVLNSVSGRLDSSCNWLTEDSLVRVEIIDNLGSPTGVYTYADADGYFWFGGGLMRSLDSTSTYTIAARLTDSSWISTDTLLHHYHLGTWGEHVLSCIPYQVQYTNNTARAQKQEWRSDLVQVSPNPTAGLCKLEGLPNGPWQLTVIDLKGRLLLNTTGDGSFSLLDISSLTTGIYIIRIQDSTTGKTAHARIILH